VLNLGGTLLGTTNRDNPFAYPARDGHGTDRSAVVAAGYHDLGLDALIGVGGDGSLGILRRLAGQGGWKLVGIPKTIDNDIRHTEHAIGFNSAVAIATEAVDRLHVTAASHSRVMVLEVMGRDAGHIALAAGIAGGADVILIPEIPYTMAAICGKIEERRRRGRNFSIVIVAESVKGPAGETITYMDAHGQSRYGGIGALIAQEIAARTGAETRVTVLGHVQRGGAPAPLDRVLASAFGVYAVDLVAAGRYDRMVAWQNRRVVDVPIAEAIAHDHGVDPDDALVHTARGLGIAFGDEVGRD
jgi:6-phosphofructokinase 1